MDAQLKITLSLYYTIAQTFDDTQQQSIIICKFGIFLFMLMDSYLWKTE